MKQLKLISYLFSESHCADGPGSSLWQTKWDTCFSNFSSDMTNWPSQDSTSGKWGERVQKPLFPVYTEGRGSLLRKVWSQSEALNASSEPNKSGRNLTGGGECGTLVWKRCRCNFPTRFFQDQLFWCQLFKHKKGETLTPTTELKVQT